MAEGAEEADTPGATVVLLPPGHAAPSWAVDMPITVAAGGSQLTTAVAGAGCVLLDGGSDGYVALARRVHAADAAVQVVVVAAPAEVQAARRGLLYAPGLGEVWIASPGEVNGALAERAAGVTAQRRKFERTRARVARDGVTMSPQRNERALISDAYLASLLRVLPDAVFSVDPQGRVLSANAAAEEMFGNGVTGARLDAALGLDAGPASDVPGLLRRTAAERYADVQVRTATGRVGDGELRAARLRVQEHEVWAVVLRDVTEYHAALDDLRASATELEAANEELQTTTEELYERTEEAESAARALRESELSFRALADAIPTLAWTARADGYIDWYNLRWYEYTGTTPEQMEGWGWQSVHDPAVLPDVMRRWTRAIETGQRFEMTFPLRAADGAFRAFLTRVVPIRDSGGEVVRWFGTNTDVEQEEESRRRIQRLQALTAALAATRTLDDVAAVVLAEAGSATQARTAVLVVRPPGEEEAIIVGQVGLPAPLLDRWRRSLPTEAGPAAHALRTGEAVFVEQRDDVEGLDARFPGMRDVWDALAAQAVAIVPLAAAGEVVGAVSFTFAAPRPFSDDDRAFFLAVGQQCALAVERARLFQAERDARNAAEEARARADEANRAKGHFLATMSHELRTPLNAISGHIQLIDMELHGPVTGAQHDALARVRVAQEHLLGLINDVLNFAKLESGRVEYAIEPVVVADVVADVAALMQPQFAVRGLTFTCDPAECGPPGLRAAADRDKLRQVLLNVLSNASKFTPSGGSVRVTVAEDGDSRVAIAVEDTGPGIPADRHAAIFEPFVQLRAPYGASNEGTGLGLAISRDLARGMQGDLTVQDGAEGGSVFTLVLPRAM